MLDVYLSHRAFVESLSSDNGLSALLRGSYISIHAADQILLDKIEEEGSIEESLAQELGAVVIPGIELAEKVKLKGRKDKIKVRKGLASSLFVLGDVTPSMIQEIENKLGVICLSDSSIEFSIKNFTRIDKYYDRDEHGDWESVLANMKGLPLNTIIVNDHYLQQYKHDAAPNLQEIIRQLLSGKTYDFVVQVLIIIGQSQRYVSDEDIKTIIRAFESITKEVSVKFKIETINCTGQNNDAYPLYKDTHNRFIMTNYGMITAETSFSAFSRGKASVPQTLSAFTNLSAEASSSEKRHKIRRRIVSDVNEALEKQRMDYKGAVWQIEKGNYSKKEISMEDISNKQIAELQDGDSCYYISVPNQNDWAKCHPLRAKDGFDSRKFASCICDRTYAKLEAKCQQIKEIFKDPCPYEQVFDDTQKFFRVMITYASDLKTIDYIESTPSEKASNQRQYKNNCFARKEDAKEVVDKILAILTK